MKRKFYVFAVWTLSHGLVFPAFAQNKYIITSYNDIQIKSKGKYLSIDDCEELSRNDSIRFGKRGFIALFDSELGEEYKYSCADAILPVKILMVEAKQETPVVNRISNYLKPLIPYEEKSGRELQAVKSEMDNDSIQAIPVTIYRFLKSNQKVNDNGLSELVSCRLDFQEKLCTVINDSDSELYIDIMYVDNEQCMSIFSPMLDWVSIMSVPSHSERTFWFVGDFRPSGQYLLVGSKRGLPLNGIFKLYRPGVEYKDRGMNIELVLRKL